MTRIGSSGIDFLQNVYKNMSAGDNMHAADARDGRGFKVTVGQDRKPHQAANAKHVLRDQLVKSLGSSAADRLLKKHGLTIKANGNRFWGIKNNKNKVTKKLLGQLLKDAKDIKFRQTLSAKPSEARKEKGVDGNFQPKDYDSISPDNKDWTQICLKAERAFVKENTVGIEKYHDIKQTVAQLKDLQSSGANEAKIAATEKKLRAQVADFVFFTFNGDDSSENPLELIPDLNIDFHTQSKLLQALDIDKQDVRNPDQVKDAVNNLELGDLLNLAEDKSLLRKVDMEIKKLVHIDVLKHMENSEFKQTSQAIKSDDPLSMTDLRNMESLMTDEDHLRQKNDVLYTRSNFREHWSLRSAKGNSRLMRIFNRGSRLFGNTQKFADAKETIRDTVTKYVGDMKAADKIMQPYMDSKSSLSKTDLARIISAADQEKRAQDKVASVQQDRSSVPNANDLINNPGSDWSDAFHSFCNAQGKWVYQNATHQIRDLNKLKTALHDMSSDFGHVDAEAMQQRLEDAKTAARAVVRNLPKGDFKTQLEALLKSDSPLQNTSSLVTLTERQKAEVTNDSKLQEAYDGFKAFAKKYRPKVPQQAPNQVNYQQQVQPTTVESLDDEAQKVIAGINNFDPDNSFDDEDDILIDQSISLDSNDSRLDFTPDDNYESLMSSGMIQNPQARELFENVDIENDQEDSIVTNPDEDVDPPRFLDD